MYETRVLSGMRPTGSLHLGHYHGVLKNWARLQAEYLCLFFVADWHALTTDYEKPERVIENGWDMVVDWLAAGDRARGQGRSRPARRACAIIRVVSRGPNLDTPAVPLRGGT